MKTCIVLLALFTCFFSSSLNAAATVTGVVTSQSSGNPIPGASIALIKGSQNVVATTTTALDGSYTFAGVNPGQYSVRASAAGFETQIIGAKAQNNQTTVVNFQLLSNPGTISGQVVDSGTLVPISGATISVFQNNFLIATETSDTNGNYTINGLDPGSYAVSALASGYQTALQGAIIQGGGQTTVLNFSLSPSPGSVSGNVIATNTGLPIAGAIIEITFDDQVIKSTQTDASGNYTFSNLFPATYDVIAHAEGFQSQEIAVVVQSNQTSTVNFSLGSFPGILSGSVIDANTSLPITGAVVLVYSNNQLIDEALTDPSGNYEVDNLAPGSYLVLARATSYQMKILPATIFSTQTTTRNFSLQNNPSTLQGQITNALTGQPIRGAAVMLFQNGMFEAVSFSDNNGNYIISSLPSGDYSLNISAKAFYTVSTSFSIGVAEVKVINTSLISDSPPIHLTGEVVKNRFLLQVDRIHHIQWQASQDPTVIRYQVYRDGEFLAVVSASDPLMYDDHNRSKNKTDVYSVNDVNTSGNVSSSVSIKLR